MCGRYGYFAALAAAWVLAAAGCGGRGKPVKVQGTVTLDGRPVEGATVTFLPQGEGGKPATGLTGSDGSFRLTTTRTGDGALPGDYKVTVTKTPAVAGAGEVSEAALEDPQKRMELYRKGGMMGGKQATAVPKSEIPPVYGDPSRTPLKWQVPSDGPVNLELSSKGG